MEATTTIEAEVETWTSGSDGREEEWAVSVPAVVGDGVLNIAVVVGGARVRLSVHTHGLVEVDIGTTVAGGDLLRYRGEIPAHALAGSAPATA